MCIRDRPPTAELGTTEPGTTEPPIAAPEPRGAGAPSVSATEALRRVATGGVAGLPSGLGLFLRTATVTEEGDRVLIEMPPGPGVEMIGDSPTAPRVLQD